MHETDGVDSLSRMRPTSNVDTSFIREAVDWTELGRRIRVVAEEAVELENGNATHVRGKPSAMRCCEQRESEER